MAKKIEGMADPQLWLGEGQTLSFDWRQILSFDRANINGIKTVVTIGALARGVKMDVVVLLHNAGKFFSSCIVTNLRFSSSPQLLWQKICFPCSDSVAVPCRWKWRPQNN